MLAPINQQGIEPLHWYLAAAKPRQELRAVEQLANQNIRAYCPRVKVEKILKGRKQLVTEALFTGYLFVHLSIDSPLWHKVRSTRGVRDWVRFATSTAKLPEQLVETLLQRELDPANEIIINRFKPGDSVRILAGPLSGLKAIFEKTDGLSRSMLLVEFLGQSNRVKIANEQIIAS